MNCYPQVMLPWNKSVFMGAYAAVCRYNLSDSNSIHPSTSKGAYNLKSRYVDFRTIKCKITILQILRHYGLIDQLHRTGNILTGTCPIHKGNAKGGFRVNISRNYWNCLGHATCGGNIIDFVAKMENVSFLDAANLLAEWFKLKKKSPSPIQCFVSKIQPFNKRHPSIVVECRVLYNDGSVHIEGPRGKTYSPISKPGQTSQ